MLVSTRPPGPSSWPWSTAPPAAPWPGPRLTLAVTDRADRPVRRTASACETQRQGRPAARTTMASSPSPAAAPPRSLRNHVTLDEVDEGPHERVLKKTDPPHATSHGEKSVSCGSEASKSERLPAVGPGGFRGCAPVLRKARSRPAFRGFEGQGVEVPIHSGEAGASLKITHAPHPRAPVHKEHRRKGWGEPRAPGTVRERGACPGGQGRDAGVHPRRRRRREPGRHASDSGINDRRGLQLAQAKVWRSPNRRLETSRDRPGGALARIIHEK